MPVHVLPVATAESARAREHALRRADDHVVDVLDDLHAAARFDLVYERYSLWGRSASAWAVGTAYRTWWRSTPRSSWNRHGTAC